MRVVSGPIGREKVHYEAPPARRVPREMGKFLRWSEKPGDIDPDLVERGALQKDTGGGRSTSYSLVRLAEAER